MKTFAQLSQQLNEWGGDSHVSDEDTYNFARHVEHAQKSAGAKIYPIKDKDGKELEWGSREHRVAFGKDPLKVESHRRALGELQAHHRAHGWPTKPPKDLARRTWHAAATQNAKQNPDWGSKANSFRHQNGKRQVTFTKQENINAGPTAKGLEAAMRKKQIHAADHEQDAALVRGYQTWHDEKYKKPYPGTKL